MQKTVVAAALGALLSSGAAGAATLVDQDGLKLHLKGDLQVQLFQKPGVDRDLDVDYDDLELKFGAKYDLGNGTSAFGELDIDWKKQGDGSDDDVVDDAYVGLAFGAVSVALGRKPWGSDNMYSEQAIEMDGGIAFADTAGSDTLQLSYAAGDIEAILSVDIEEGEDEAATDLYIGGKLAGADVAVAFQSYEATPDADAVDTVGVLAKFKAGPAKIGVDFSSNDNVDVVNLSAGMPVAAKTKAAVGVTQVSPDGGDEVLHWYLNATHKLHKQVSAFVEVGNSDEDDSDMGFLAGMRVKF